MEVNIPVSFGELLDKISILEIKSEQITQPDRLHNVRHELRLLTAVREQTIGRLPQDVAMLATELKVVNKRIWDAEDAIHAGKRAASLDEAEFAHHARVAFNQNDERARLKRQINDLTGSNIVEEKSYPDFGSQVEAASFPNGF